MTDPEIHAVDKLRQTLGFVPKRIAVQGRRRRYVEYAVPGPVGSPLGALPFAVTNAQYRVEVVEVSEARWCDGENVRPKERISRAMGLWDDEGTPRGFWAFPHAFVVEVAPEVLGIDLQADSKRQAAAATRYHTALGKARALLLEPK